MRNLAGALLVLLVLGSIARGADTSPGCDTVRDLSRFQKVAYRQQSHRGFCAPLNSVLRATLVPDGEVLVLMTVRYVSRSPDCGDDGLDPRCVVEGPRTCRRLSADDSARVRQALAAVRTCAGDPACFDEANRSCVTRVLTWNSESFGDACFSQPRLQADDARRIEALIDKLADGPTVACSPKSDDGF